MGYTENYHALQSVFNINEQQILMPNSTMRILTFEFNSTPLRFSSIEGDAEFQNSDGFNSEPDCDIRENNKFRYPIFLPDDKVHGEAILLIHGLNERSWDKYLAWAKELCQRTQKPIILFPISFHMNRSPKEWSNPRRMSVYVDKRKQHLSKSTTSCFANLALSERLSENPLRFFTSGLQTAYDLVQLARSIKQGDHPLFQKDTHLDFFAYSIGAFLSQILLLANPENLFSQSRLFMFCGGSVFSEMVGSSKLIMDEQAFDRLYSFYESEIDAKMQTNSELIHYVKESNLGQSFLSMLSFDKLKQFNSDSFKRLSKQISVITLLKDKVIPARGILTTLGLNDKSENVEVLDFPYSYSHEVPFLAFSDPNQSSVVDQCFDHVFKRAALFLR